MGLAIGITGWICDERRGHHLLPLMREIPADKLDDRDGRAVPAAVRDLKPKRASTSQRTGLSAVHIAATIAHAPWNESVDSVAASTSRRGSRASSGCLAHQLRFVS